MSQNADDELADVVAEIREDLDLQDTSSDRLFKGEVFWRDHQPWLLKRGYQLRARYQPDWRPSWKTNGRWKKHCEDSYTPKRVYLMDAVRTSDGAFVVLKKILKASHPQELKIGQYFSAEPLRADTRNHSVPILEALEVPDDDAILLIVMPLMRKFDDPPFSILRDVVSCIQQAFEGVAFMHQHHVAHRDCSSVNFMMDPVELFPVPFHPVLTYMTRDIRMKVHPLARSECYVKYYWIDFGIARQYRSGDRPPSEKIVLGADKSPPEHKSKKGRCDPFPTDVYYVGNLVRESFLQRYRNVDFLDALVKRMVHDDPSKRPSMDQVMLDFTKLVKNLSHSKLNARLVNRKEFFAETFARDTVHSFRGLFSRTSSSR